MSSVVTRRVEIVEEINPAEMARIFFGMSDEEQAEFFEALHDEVTQFYESADPNAWRCYGLGEMQWLCMKQKMSTKARQMYMALSAFAFEYWPQRAE